jgi:hypothetical protein
MKDFPISKYAGSSDALDEKAGNEEGSPRQRARGEVQRILETHRVEPLPEELEAALLKIAEAEPRAAVA